ARDLALTLHASMSLERHENDARARFGLRQGQIASVVLESAGDGPPGSISPDEVLELFLQTVGFWRDWLARPAHTGRWREMVTRSAMTLKLMTYAPTGALVAAVTTGLPEQIGGERNWDYRYTWIRDASFSVYALLGLGYTEEADAFLHWVDARVSQDVDVHAATPPLKIMYRVDGSSDLREESLDHWEGYLESRPVRIGNGASDQLQLDIYGELLDSMYLADTQGLRISYSG